MVTVTQVTDLLAQLSGLAILAGTLAVVGAFVYRWYVREPIPRGLALLLGLSGVAVYLNTTTALGQVIGGSTVPTETEVALFNITAFLAGAGGATLGRWAGDWGGAELFFGDGFADVEDDVGRLVQSVGRVVAVELPQDIGDVVGYDPVPEETKATLAGKTFLFPRRVTVSELRERLVARLKSDYGVGHVDIDLAEDGSVEYLALGSRAAGIGPTLPPATNAVAIRADPAFAASAGDLVQVWETDPMRRVLTAELRGVAEDTVTVAIDAADTQKLDPTREYRLVTLPVEDRPDREFASLLRAAEETFSSVTVEAGSPLHGLPIAALDIAVVAVTPDGETPMALPDADTLLAPGDVVFAIARPDTLRRLAAAGEPLDPALASEPTPRQSGVESDSPARQETTTQPDPEQAQPSHPAGPEDHQPAAGADSPTAQAETSTGPAVTDSDEDSQSATTAPDPAETAEAVSAEAETGDETADFDPPAASDAGDAGDSDTGATAGDASFQQLKDEFDSGEADWTDDDSTGDESAVSASADTEESATPSDDAADDSGGDGLNSALGEAGDDLDFEEADDDLSGLDFEEDDGDDDLSSLGFDDEDGEDDLSSLDFDEDEDDDGLSLEDEDDSGDEADDGDDGDDDDDDDDDDSGGSGGGASSFQQLKEEFDSGEADWEDDISDSPGGDMRLDE